jgi:hypothetical protein
VFKCRLTLSSLVEVGPLNLGVPIYWEGEGIPPGLCMSIVASNGNELFSKIPESHMQGTGEITGLLLV